MSKKSARRKSVVSKDLTETKKVVGSAERADIVKDFAPKVSEERFVIKVGGNKWLKSYSPFVLCDNKSDAGILNSDWAIGHQQRITAYEKLKAEIVKL